MPGFISSRRLQNGIVRLEQVDELRALRAWADDRHVALEHVPQLRELVEVRPAQEAAGRRRARIAGLGEHGLAGPLRRHAASSGTCTS